MDKILQLHLFNCCDKLPDSLEVQTCICHSFLRITARTCKYVNGLLGTEKYGRKEILVYNNVHLKECKMLEANLFKGYV